MVFDVNDFDETLPGPWEWDLKRLVASLAIAAAPSGVDDKLCAEIVSGAVRSYRAAMREFAGMAHLSIWYSRLDTETVQRWRSEASREADHPNSGPGGQGEVEGQPAGRGQVDRPAGRAAALRVRRSPPRAGEGADRRRRCHGVGPRRSARALPPEPSARASQPAERLPRGRHGPEGGRRRQRRHPGVDRPARRKRRRGRPHPAGQGGAGLGARGPRRPQRVRPSRGAGRGGPAPYAEFQRHLPGLGDGNRHRRTGSALLRPPALGLEGLGRPGHHPSRQLAGLRRALQLDPGPGPRPLR